MTINLKAIRERADKAAVYDLPRYLVRISGGLPPHISGHLGNAANEIAKSRTDIPALLDEVDRMIEENRQLAAAYRRIEEIGADEMKKAESKIRRLRAKVKSLADHISKKTSSK